MAHNAANCRACGRAQQATPQHRTGGTTHCRTGGCAFFLLGHAGTGTQYRHQRQRGQNREQAVIEFHNKYLQEV